MPGLPVVRGDEPADTGPPTTLSTSPRDAGELRQLIAQLDDSRFEARNQATRQLIARETRAIPFLVEALTESSGELRLRAQLLLARHNSFEDVAPHLARAACQSQGALARAVLQARADRHLEAAFQLPHSEKLFQFWGKRTDAFREQVRTSIAEAKTVADAERAIDPLLELDDKVARFNNALNRLESLSLPYQHAYSPGLIIAKTLARGLHDNDASWTTFAERHIQAFETLAERLRGRDATAHEVRTEIAERANMSQGAATYLVQLLEPDSVERATYLRRIDIRPEQLRDAFFEGLAHPDSRECEWRVGKLHIADMLGDALDRWPDAPREGVVPKLTAEVVRTIESGNKPKALALLDALEACRDLSGHHLNATEGLGKRLAERLGAEALTAADNRAYFPARYVHDRFLSLVDQGIRPEHPAFPTAVLESHLAGDPEGMSDARRLAIERYLRLLERVRTAGLTWEQPGVVHFTQVMRDSVTSRPEELVRGVAELDRLVAESRQAGHAQSPEELERALELWASKMAG